MLQSKTKQWEDAELLNFTRLAHVGNCIRLYADIRDDVTFDAKSCFHVQSMLKTCLLRSGQHHFSSQTFKRLDAPQHVCYQNSRSLYDLG